MKTLQKIFLIFGIIILNSCGGGDDSPSYSISLSSSASSVQAGQSVTFTVTDNSGANVSSSAVIKVNGETISSNVYTPTVAGTYTVVATNNGAISNTLSLTVTAAPVPVSSITLTSNKSVVGSGENIIYSVIANNGQNLSPQAQIYFNDVLQTGFNIPMNDVGVISVYAKYTNADNVTFTSNTIQVEVVSVINFTKRVLIEDFTGTWCQFCPRVSYAIELVKQQTSNAEVVAIHQGNDPYNISVSPYTVSGYPTAKLNRTTEWSYPENSNVAQAVNLTTGANPRIGVAITSSLSGNTLSATVNVKSGYNFSNLKLVAYVTEDKLYYNQINSTSFYGGVNPIVNFEHNHVLRSVLTNIMGNAIPGTLNSGDTYNTTFTYNVPSNFNSANLSIVAFVVDNSGKAINVRTSPVGTSQSFEQQ